MPENANGHGDKKGQNIHCLLKLKQKLVGYIPPDVMSLNRDVREITNKKKLYSKPQTLKFSAIQ